MKYAQIRFFSLMVTILVTFACSTKNLYSQTVSSHEFGGHTYLIVNEPMNWTNANTVAENSLGYLAIIGSEAENQFIFNKLSDANIESTAFDGGGARYAWLGGSEAESEGEWMWVDSTSFSPGYTNWGNGPWGPEPDDYPIEQPRSQNHLAMGLDGWPTFQPGGYGTASQWNDVNGVFNQLAYVIEFNSPTLDTDSDGLTDWEEFIAASDPTNATSQLKLNISRPTQNEFVLSWPGSSECSYSIETKTNLTISGWNPTTNISGSSSTMSYTNTSNEMPIFYMIRVER